MTPARTTSDWIRDRRDELRRLDDMQVVFVVGPGKTGSTWLMRTLHGHDRVAARGECNLCTVLLPKLIDAFRTFNAFQQSVAPAETRITDDAFFVMLRQIYDRVLLNYVEAKSVLPGRPVLAVVDKTPANSAHVGLLSHLYPGSRFICCTRDPRDAAVSAWFHFHHAGLTGTMTMDEYAVAFLRDSYRPLLVRTRAAARTLGPERYMEVEYAEHSETPDRCLRSVLPFVGVSADDSDIRRCRAAGAFERFTGGRSRGTEDRRSFCRKGIVGDWRNHFSEEFGAFLLEILETPLEEPACDHVPRSMLTLMSPCPQVDTGPREARA